MRTLFLFLILNLTFFGFSQLTAEQESKIDSLQQVIETAKHDTIIVNAWIEWDNIIYITNPDLDLDLNLKIDSLCTIKLNSKLNKKEVEIYLKHKAFALNNIGIIYDIQGDYDKGIDYYSQSLEIFEEIGNKQGIATSLNNIGTIYKVQGDYAKAIDYFTQNLKISEEIGNKQGVGACLNNIGLIFQVQRDYSKALDYFTQSIKINEEISNKKGIASSLNNIGIIYQEQGDYSMALDYYTQSLKIEDEIGDKGGIASSLNNIGLIFQKQGDDSTAIDYFNQSVKINEEIGDRELVTASLIFIGNSYENKGYYDKALKYGSRALSIAQEIGATIRISGASSLLWKINKKLGRYKSALEMYELYISSRDSLESKENQKEVIRQEYKYAYEKQAIADSIAAAEQSRVKDAQLFAEKAKTKQQQQQSYFLLGILILSLIFGGVIFNRFRINNKQKRIIEKQKREVDGAFHILEEKNQEILDSISYAKRIQNAILPPQKLVKEYLNNSFIIYKPKDIVAGDFFWVEPTKKAVFFAVADCTGHGVPGAMVSVLCNNGLNRSVREHGLSDPGKILDKTREIIIQEFEKSEEEVKDGMDIALCSIEENKLKYAGAHNPLWLVRGGQVIEIKANKQPIGKFDTPKPYTTHVIDLQKGDTIYLFSDGYTDQFGGAKGKKFKAKAFKELLIRIEEKSMEEQKSIIDATFENWKGNLDQLDDVCILGLRI